MTGFSEGISPESRQALAEKISKKLRVLPDGAGLAMMVVQQAVAAIEIPPNVVIPAYALNCLSFAGVIKSRHDEGLPDVAGVDVKTVAAILREAADMLDASVTTN